MNGITYLVYSWRGEIKVKQGRMMPWGTFSPVTGTYPWMSKCPTVPMKINSRGKVWCLEENQIPIAKEMVREHVRCRLENAENVYSSAKRNAEKIINGGDKE